MQVEYVPVVKALLSNKSTTLSRIFCYICGMKNFIKELDEIFCPLKLKIYRQLLDYFNKLF